MLQRTLLTIGMVGMLATPTLAQDADMAAQGEKVFKRCAACHKIGEGARNSVGPSLEGVIGRTAGTGDDFNYSDAMVAAGEGGLVWDDAALMEYLAAPREVVKGTKMTFAGLKSEDDRKAVIAYIEANGG